MPLQRHELDALEDRVLVGGRDREADVARGLGQDVRGGRQQVVDQRRVADLLPQPGLDARRVPGRPPAFEQHVHVEAVAQVGRHPAG